MPVFLSSIGTATPEYCTSQSDIGQYMIENLNLNDQEAHELKVLYRATGIGTRYSVLSDFSNGQGLRFFENGSPSYIPSVGVRMDRYKEEAVKLGVQALDQALGRTDIVHGDITHLITVSCTGMYAPGLDIDLIQNTGIKTSVERTSINFMGCYAAFTALKTAKNIVLANPDAVVAVIAVELCSLHLQKKTDEDSILSNALFGDGAACGIITKGNKSRRELMLELQHSDLALHGKSEMKWDINEFGFEMKLTSKVPEIIESDIRSLTENLLKTISKKVDQIDYFAIHPGGKRILQVIESELGITKEDNKSAREVLKDFGNMSSPTIFFVLHHLLESMEEPADGKNVLAFAFGPGLTLESMLMSVRFNDL